MECVIAGLYAGAADTVATNISKPRAERARSHQCFPSVPQHLQRVTNPTFKRRFFAALKTSHSNSRLDEAKLQNLYRSSGKAFKPNWMAKAQPAVLNGLAAATDVAVRALATQLVG
eukprot:Skav207910  [mRNA]  locus=scaffold190:194238:195027:- [translate_table: standard]